jgi:hypothetical protein
LIIKLKKQGDIVADVRAPAPARAYGGVGATPTVRGKKRHICFQCGERGHFAMSCYPTGFPHLLGDVMKNGQLVKKPRPIKDTLAKNLDPLFGSDDEEKEGEVGGDDN